MPDDRGSRRGDSRSQGARHPDYRSTDFYFPEYSSTGYHASDNDFTGSDSSEGYSRSQGYRYPNHNSSDGYARGRAARDPEGYSGSRNARYSGGRDSRYADSSYSGSRNARYLGDTNARYAGGASNNRGSRNHNTGYPQRRSANSTDKTRSGYTREYGDYYSSREYEKTNQYAYRSGKSEGDKLPISVFLGMGVTAIAVIALIISVLANSNNTKNQSQPSGDNFTSSSDRNGTTIVDVEDDELPDEYDSMDSSAPAVQSFVGMWYKTNVTESQKAELTVTLQYSDSFEFRLETWNGSKSAVIKGTAFYTDETHAEYSPKKKVKLTFERGIDNVVVTHTGSNSSLGIGKDYLIDGNFTEQAPTYTDESNTSSETTVAYDYNIYQSDAVVEALQQTLRSDDYALYKDMMKNGLKSPINYERTKDKNGKLINVDAELNAVKYYAHVNGNDMIFICSEKADIYVLFYNSDEIIYYTNDSHYSFTMPASFQAVAQSKGIKPTFR